MYVCVSGGWGWGWGGKYTSIWWYEKCVYVCLGGGGGVENAHRYGGMRNVCMCVWGVENTHRYGGMRNVCVWGVWGYGRYTTI